MGLHELMRFTYAFSLFYIVSIKLCYNSRKEYSSDKRLHSKPVEEG